jgi:hypothetical protein
LFVNRGYAVRVGIEVCIRALGYRRALQVVTLDLGKKIKEAKPGSVYIAKKLDRGR